MPHYRYHDRQRLVHYTQNLMARQRHVYQDLISRQRHGSLHTGPQGSTTSCFITQLMSQHVPITHNVLIS